jgi:hypothetical protein
LALRGTASLARRRTSRAKSYPIGKLSSPGYG